MWQPERAFAYFLRRVVPVTTPCAASRCIACLVQSAVPQAPQHLAKLQAVVCGDMIHKYGSQFDSAMEVSRPEPILLAYLSRVNLSFKLYIET